MAWLRGLGYTVGKAEQRVDFGRTTRDLFGFIDVVAIKAGRVGVLGVQATSAAHVADRVKKVKAEPRAALWLACRNDLWVVGWAKKGAHGKRKLWVPSVVNCAPECATLSP